MQPERVVRTISDLKKALADLQREGHTILHVDGRKVLLLPWDQSDDLTDDEFERLLSHPVVKARLDKAVAQAEAGLGVADDEFGCGIPGTAPPAADPVLALGRDFASEPVCGSLPGGG